jgi:hypothetical protein
MEWCRPCDALPSSWLDSNVSLEWKQRKNHELGHAPWFTSLSGVEGRAGVLDGTRKNDKQLIHSHELAQNQTISWLVHCWSTFGVRNSHGQTQTHHGLDLGEVTTFPLIVYFVPLHEAHIQMTFCLELPFGSPEIANIGIPTTLGSHNFVCRPSMETRFEAKL